jgi:eukaryotic-like serine/threonine-protein kinase
MPRAPDLAGSALDGRYELLGVLGEGSFGRVYRGRDLRLGRVVAVKVIKPWWAEDDAWVERFAREARLLARVSDPGVVRIYDFGEAEEGPYYVTELVEGESLADRLRRGPLPVEEARGIAEQLCAALAGAHRVGVVHCDVKPANVLLGEDGRVRVGDFGVARVAEGTSQAVAATVAGTPRYMSPEQARGRPTSPATDVYSAGVVLYEMLTGEPPFREGSVVELGLRHLQDPPPPLPETVPAQLRAIAEKAMAKRPSARFADGGEMERALHAARGAKSGAAPASPERVRAISPRLPDAAAGATRPLDREALATRSLDRGSERTRVLGGAPPEPPAMGPRRRGGPSRRRAWIALVAAAAAIGGLIAAVQLTSGAARTVVPELRRLPRGGVEARARRLHVHPVFSEHHSETPDGIAIAQSPRPGIHVDQGSTVEVVLSSGPPPVPVPGVVGKAASTAETTIAEAGLRYSLTRVPSPGSMPGTVVRQSPSAPANASRGSTIALSIAETPEWRTLTSFAGADDGKSVPFRILGDRWRVVYDMSFDGTCLLLVICDGPSAEASSLSGGGNGGSFDLGEGEDQTHVFTSGPGIYRLQVSGGRDSARWSMHVQDYY